MYISEKRNNLMRLIEFITWVIFLFCISVVKSTDNEKYPHNTGPNNLKDSEKGNRNIFHVYEHKKYHPYNRNYTHTKQSKLVKEDHSNSYEYPKKKYFLCKKRDVTNQTLQNIIDNPIKIEKQVQHHCNVDYYKCGKRENGIELTEPISMSLDADEHYLSNIDKNVYNKICNQIIGDSNFVPSRNLTNPIMCLEKKIEENDQYMKENPTKITNHLLSQKISQTYLQLMNDSKIEDIVNKSEQANEDITNNEHIREDTNNKKETINETNKDEETKKHIKKEDTEEVIQTLIDEQSLQDGNFFKNVYLREFKITLKKLHDINKLIKNVNTNNIVDIKKSIDEIKKSQCQYVNHLIVDLPVDKWLYAWVSSINNLKNRLTKCKKPNLFSQTQSNPIVLLNSIISMQLYLELCSNFSFRSLDRVKKSIKNIMEYKINYFKCLPTKGEELTRNASELTKIFLKLRFRIDPKNKIYNMRGYYASVFCIKNILINDMEEGPFCLVSFLMNEILKTWQKFVSVRVITSLPNQVNLPKSIIHFESPIFKKEKENIKNLIALINENQEKLKEHIMNHIEESETLNRYIIQHLSYLILYRCFCLTERIKELQNCLHIYKSFLILGNSILTNNSMTTTTHDSEETRKYIIYEDIDLMYYIFSYVLLNIIKVILVDFDYNHTKYINMLKDKINNKIPSIELYHFYQETKFYKDSLDALNTLADSLKIIIKNKSLIIITLRTYYLENQVNKIIERILSKLDSLKNTNTTTDEIHHQIAKEYDILYLLFNEYIKTSKKSMSLL